LASMAYLEVEKIIPKEMKVNYSKTKLGRVFIRNQLTEFFGSRF